MNRHSWCLILSGALLASAPGLCAQVATGGIRGVVKDRSGGVIQGGTVEARNLATATTRSTVTDAEGRYSFESMPVGTYQISAVLAGFHTTVRSGIGLSVGQEA